MSEKGINLICLGLNIRRWRRGMRLTQAELAAKVGCGVGTISAIEHGRRDVSIEMLFRLSRALMCPVKELLQGVGESSA